jgi:uncharacterized damage-inducible protein DinB
MSTTAPAITPEFALAYRAMVLEGFANEVETTKRVLAAVPDGKRDYRPDPNARTAWELAWHIANSDIQFLDAIADMKFTMETPDQADKPKTTAELVAWYDRNFQRAADRVRALTSTQLTTPVDFMGAFNFPAVLYLGFLNNHSIHHRGQLAAYLRPMGSKCPSIYGGSYDEPWQPAQAETNAA